MEDKDAENGHRGADQADNGGAGGATDHSTRGAEDARPNPVAALNAELDAAILADLAPGKGPGVGCPHNNNLWVRDDYDPMHDLVIRTLKCEDCGRPHTVTSSGQARMTIAPHGTPYHKLALPPHPLAITQHSAYRAMSAYAVSSVMPMGGSLMGTKDALGQWQAPPPLKSEMQVGEIKAWRAWRVVPSLESGTGKLALRSTHMDTIWPADKPMECDATVPDRGAKGIYACKDITDLMGNMNGMEIAMGATQEPYVIGRVSLWGDVIEHATGYRAQYAKIIELNDVLYGGKPEEKEILHELRLAYGFGDDGYRYSGKPYSGTSALPDMRTLHTGYVTWVDDDPPPRLPPWFPIAAGGACGLAAIVAVAFIASLF